MRGSLAAGAFRVTVAVAAVVVSTLLLTSVELRREAPIEEGEPSPRTVVSPSLVRVEDQEATDRAKREAAAAVEEVEVRDQEAQREAVQRVQDVFAAVGDAREPQVVHDGDGQEDEEDDGDEPEPEVPSEQEQVAALEDRIDRLDAAELEVLVRMSDDDLDRAASEAVAVTRQVVRARITEEDVDRVADEDVAAELALRTLPGDSDTVDVLHAVVGDAVRPTVVVDEDATEEARRDAAESVAPVTRSYPGGSPIVEAGEVVDELQMRALRQHGLVGTPPLATFAQAAVMLVATALIAGVLLRSRRPRVWRSPRRLVLLAVLGVGGAAAVAAVRVLAETQGQWLWFVLPAAAVPMVTTLLLDSRVGAGAALATAAMAAAASGGVDVVVHTATAGVVSAVAAHRVSSRADLRAGVWVAALAGLVTATSAAAALGGWAETPRVALASAGGAAASGVLVAGATPFLESAFRLVTPMGLVDMTDRNHPLLRQLERDAIGSYNHSVAVATLVDAAARRVGADPLLASVQALYHDIGKVQRPEWFVENQLGVPNPHDDVEPEVSARIIMDHVDDGVRMARAHHLPEEVVEGVASHHGTTKVGYFYQVARQRDSAVDEEQFRYTGPRPRTKESALLLLADSCESATRANAHRNRDLTEEDIQELVDGLIDDRVYDGQLDDSPLTFSDLAEVRRSFVETLVGMYHPRVRYPDTATAGSGAR